MTQAVEMFFDDQADERIRRLWQSLADHDLPSLATLTHRRHRPHVSLTVAETLDSVNLDELGTFPSAEGVLFVGVTATAELLTFRKRVHPALPDTQIKHWLIIFRANGYATAPSPSGWTAWNSTPPIPNTYGTDSACSGRLA